MYRSVLETPLGQLRLITDDRAVRSLSLTSGESVKDPTDAVGCRAVQQLREYFAGTRTEFDLVLDPDGTEFQKAVWHQLCSVPLGETRTYGQIAQAVGCPGGSRAVGGAVGKNPILIVIPCHRIVAADGIGGFSAGLEKKRILLAWEGVIFP